MSPKEQEEVPFEARLLDYVDPEPVAPGLKNATGLVALASANRDFFTSEYMSHTWKTSSIKNKLEEGKNLKAQQKAEKSLPSDVHFKLDRLQNDAECFRLLKVQSVDPKGLIECTVEEFSFARRPPFVALSYVWSDKGPVAEFSRDFRRPDNDQLWPLNPGELRKIKCNGKPCDVSANLHAALAGLNKSLSGRYLWVDAVCIDQTAGNENHEKGVQVQNMHKIYGGADEVFIWLGRKHKGRDIAFSLLESWPRFPDDVSNANIAFRGKTYRTAKDFMDATAAKAELLSWGCLMQAVSEGWFQRVWTLQEFILARKYSFFYDGKQIPTEAMKSAMSWVYFICQMGPSTILPAWINFQPSIFTLKQDFDQKGQKLDFAKSVFLGGTRLAKDPHDKVYALLAVTDPESLRPSADLPALTVQYDLPMQDLYLDTALRLLHGTAGLSILSLVHHPLAPLRPPKSKKPIGNRLLDEHRGKSRGWTKTTRSVIAPAEDPSLPSLQPDWRHRSATDAFPSWVPQLTTTLGSAPLSSQRGGGGGGEDANIFRAAAGVPASFRTSGGGGGGHRVLTVAAKPVDRIARAVRLPQSVRPLHWTRFAEKAERAALWDLVAGIVGRGGGGDGKKGKKRAGAEAEAEAGAAGITSGGWYAPTGERGVAAVWRTLVGDVWNKRHHPAPGYVEVFFLNWLAKASCVDEAKVRRGLGLEREVEYRREEVFEIGLREGGLDRWFVVTEKGYFGLAPPRAEVGDEVVLVAGMGAPVTLKKHTAGENKWLFVGETYVHGIMKGEFEDGGRGFVDIDIL
ncbi:heterokaryon incompatibility protein or allele [Diplodia corticola]|uniref:Heterokaryon incompatibility protein or allele n=1 Tax=Diplodia corticola TaxID=236234 RepID=A0A1J9RVB1_9PEZI|nr:heterokaryon incompatibility protein or allele [Diplodia corticola]OJD36539.1 heterokaryon incompatibility protein or allele [Diplodia corticola]